jgi:hypothetical protein
LILNIFFTVVLDVVLLQSIIYKQKVIPKEFINVVTNLHFTNLHLTYTQGQTALVFLNLYLNNVLCTIRVFLPFKSKVKGVSHPLSAIPLH